MKKVAPARGKLALFYSLLPNGELDEYSLHGGCPVKAGRKWAANKWLWNKPFDGGSQGAVREEGGKPLGYSSLLYQPPSSSPSQPGITGTFGEGYLGGIARSLLSLLSTGGNEEKAEL